ncbi:MAG TPA: S-layer homology domain-containing protein, partial [Thermoanaerobaculia bacterium]|nr:S-layer homology domain-containing protein [Thermoanaerobaculia bacterium]
TQQYGVEIEGATGVIVGGTNPADRNLLSANDAAHVLVGDFGGNNTIVKGNLIGTDATGTVGLPGMFDYANVYIRTGTGQMIGGPTAAERNVISGNTHGSGVGVGYTVGGTTAVATIQGNFIGTDVTGTLNLGNVQGVVAIGGNNWIIGGPNPGEGNVIAFNGSPYAIAVGAGTGNTIRGNSMYGNAALGIDLYAGGGAGVTPNASTTTIQGILNSTASTTFDVDLYATAPCINVPQAYVQGQIYLGTFQVTTDGSCNASFSHDVAVVLQPGQIVTATATDPNGNTSEFSQRLVFSQSPASGPAAGGTSATLNGMLFESGATVTVGGVPATNVMFVNDSTITATMPARPAGSLNDTVVSNPSGTGGTLVNGWIADFNDVGGNQFYYYITKLVSNEITVGCGSGNYCPDSNVTRQQMAVFLLKGKHGLCYVPPACTPGFFADVACPSTYANWIQALATEGITGGCGGGNYCPTNPVRRDQMAVFLMKAEHGSSYVPPVCTGVFTDVPCPGTFTNWIEELYHESIAAGCGSGLYCPSNPNTRGQMAVFITRTFSLP